MFEIKETRYQILDNPIKKDKYILKKIYYWLISPIYKLINYFYKAEVIPKKYYCSICAVFKNEAPYLEEWIEYHRIVGIEHFYLYNNFSEDNYESVLSKYVDEGILTLIEWPYLQGQMSAYNNCVDSFKEETNWIAFIDLDEFIVPNEECNISKILRRFEQHPVVIAYWRMFCSSGRLRRDLNNLVIEDFTICARKDTNIGKVFYNTAYDWAPNNRHNTAMHYRVTENKHKILLPVNFFGHISWGGVDKVDSDYPPVQINHYVTRSFEEYVKKIDRGDAYFVNNPRTLDYFYIHEHLSESVDYKIYKYLLELKENLNR